MADSDSSSSDDDVAHLIAKTREQYYESQRKRRRERGAAADDESSASSAAGPGAAVVRTEVGSKLERLEQHRRIRERARRLQQLRQETDSDEEDKEEDDDGAAGGAPRIVDKHRLQVDVKIQNEQNGQSALDCESSSDEEKYQARRLRQQSLPCHQNNQELLAIQAAREKLKTAQRYKASSKEVILVASPPTSPAGSVVCLVEEWSLVVECKLMQQGEIRSNRTVQVQIWKTATIAELQEKILKACGLSDQAAVVSTLTANDRVLCRSSSARSTKTLSSCPTLRSGSALSATLHLTGLSVSTKKDARDVEEEEQRKLGKSIMVCLRRMVGKKEEREQWSIRERETFSNLLSRYQEKYQIQVVLKFDGETIEPSQTPKDHDIEDEDLIDVVEKV